LFVKEINGRVGRVAHIHPPQTRVPHLRDSLIVADKTTTGGPGTYAYDPRNVPHQWTNMGSGRGQLLNVYTPGGIDKFFLAVGIPIHSSTDQPQVDLAAYEARTKPLREKTGIIRLGPPKYP
jgi:hypothetical protein